VGAIASLAVTGSLSVAAPLRAQSEASLSVAWSAPATCPTAEDLERDVAQILGGPARPEPPLRANVEVRAAVDGTWRARLATTQGGAEGERELSGVDCEEVAHAVALVLALMVAPVEPATPSHSGVAPASDPVPLPGASPASASSSAPRRRLPLLVRTGATLGMGTLPDLDAGMAAHLGLWGDRWSAEVRIAAWLPQTATIAAEPDEGAKFWMLAATPVACFRQDVGPPVRLDACAGVGVTWMHARGFGMTDPTSVTARWGTVRVEQAVSLALSEGVALRPGLQLSWPLSRPRFAVRNLAEVHRPEKTAVSGVLAVEFGF